MVRTPVNDEPRSTNVLVRVLPSERARWHAASKRAGKTLSEWLRVLANRAADTKPRGKR